MHEGIVIPSVIFWEWYFITSCYLSKFVNMMRASVFIVFPKCLWNLIEYHYFALSNFLFLRHTYKKGHEQFVDPSALVRWKTFETSTVANYCLYQSNWWSLNEWWASHHQLFVTKATGDKLILYHCTLAPPGKLWIYMCVNGFIGCQRRWRRYINLDDWQRMY